ncbi:hypothetical protein BG011_007626 [Mortierella polycephala]|uniref:Uncharacterized protein n=1 Tax=Mortierella polycephala TaxID=41804 RepID=A0A9P6TYD6_9FUNG|nr:hypothetical protein BG011_007626 [Mortierella polycephala]
MKGNLEPPPYKAQAQYPQICCITLNETDKLRLIGTPPELIPLLRDAIKTSWGAIQRERNYNGSFEFKMLGNPWYGQGADSVKSRRLIVSVLKTMVQHGWELIQAADVSKKNTDKDSLFFEYIEQSTEMVDTGEIDMFAVSFNRYDRLRIIDGPARIIPTVREAIQQQWRSGIQEEQIYFSAMEFKLHGYPFFADGQEAVMSRMMLSQILANVKAQGYRLYTSVDISIGHEGADAETWVFRAVRPA